MIHWNGIEQQIPGSFHRWGILQNLINFLNKHPPSQNTKERRELSQIPQQSIYMIMKKTRQECSIPQYTKGSDKNRLKKGSKSHQMEKEEVKLFLFVDDVVLYVEF